MDELDMSGRTVFVTGGGRGVGRAITERFLGLGAQVAICGRSTPEDMPSVDGRRAVFYQCDVRSYEDSEATVGQIASDLGGLDVLVNNAGGSPPGYVSDVSPRFLKAIIELNLIGPLNMSKVANDVMQSSDSGGAIINISSVNGSRPSPGTAAYGSAKAGLLNLTTSLAVEWAPKVRVNAVTAGIIGTPELFETYYGNDPEVIAALAAGVPMGRLATPDDIANACVFLASPLSSHMTGANMVVDGGGTPLDTHPKRADD